MPEQVVGLASRHYRVTRRSQVHDDQLDLNGISDLTIFNQQIVVLLRRRPELVVLTLDGELLNRISLKHVMLGHGIRALGDDLVAITDVDGHQVLLLDPDFREHHRLHCGNRPALGQPFNHPTDCTRDNQGRLLISDGYGNSLLHCFTADYRFSHSVGEAGSGEGQFSTPHAVVAWGDSHIAMADRENNRVQIFDEEHRFVRSLTGLYKPMALEVVDTGLLVSDQTPRLSLFDHSGTLIGRCRTFSTYAHGLATVTNADAPSASPFTQLFIADMLPDGLTRLQLI